MTETSLQDTVETLVRGLAELVGEVRVLRMALDELTSELEWQGKQTRRPPRSPFMLHSMSLDPAAEDWQVNAPSAKDSQGPSAATSKTGQKALFDKATGPSHFLR